MRGQKLRRCNFQARNNRSAEAEPIFDAQFMTREGIVASKALPISGRLRLPSAAFWRRRLQVQNRRNEFAERHAHVTHKRSLRLV